MKDFIKLEDIANELNVSRRTIQRLASKGEIPIVTIRGQGGFKYVSPIQNCLE